MKDTYLEVTFRKGKPLAAYLYLPRPPGAKSGRTEVVSPGLLVDYSADGVPIGLEITAPRRVTADDVNEALRRLGLSPLAPEDLKPIPVP